MDYSLMTYDELLREEEILKNRNSEIKDECLKENKSWNDYCELSHDVAYNLYLISKYIRLKQTPVVEYGKKWRGKKMPLETFIEECEKGRYYDLDGEGHYATENARADIVVCPSDIMEGIYRKDFPFVIWAKTNDKTQKLSV